MLLTLALNTETTPSNNKIFEQTAIYADENQGHGLEQSHNVCRIKTCDALATLPLPNFELVLPQLI
jgi:hypothetical protein